jgi:hypothetical protein
VQQCDVGHPALCLHLGHCCVPCWVVFHAAAGEAVATRYVGALCADGFLH